MNFLQKDIMQIQFDINLQKTSSVVRKQNINIIFSFITTAYKTFLICTNGQRLLWKRTEIFVRIWMLNQL